MFGRLGAFSEFEHEMIAARIIVGLACAKEKIERDTARPARPAPG
jgi:hypothetical protein